VNEVKKKQIMKDAERRKTENRRKHSKPGAVPFKSERKKRIIAQLP
jgi:WD repeat and SOF domain-containing protein 1